MSYFNQKTRSSNALKSSAVGLISAVVSFVLGFGYRTLFIWILGAGYLGVNGLFSSILSALSMAELGVTAAISYRLYKPIGLGDVRKVGQIMVFFKWTYRLIAAVIMFLGCLLLPFLDFFIADTAEVPGDINLQLVYFLFLLQSAVSYLYSYRLLMLGADQRGYTYNLVQMIITFTKYAGQIAVLFVTRDYTITLASAIALNLGLNIAFSIWVTGQYREVFSVKEMLPKDERIQIYKDTFGAMCHKVGDVVLRATDNIVISKFVSIVATGMYSNYILLVDCVRSLLKTVMTSFISSIGNAHVLLSAEENHQIYSRLMFFSLWVVSLCTVCIFLLINSFIELWVGSYYVLDRFLVTALSISFFIELNRPVSGAFTSATGLFVKDRGRPFIEAGINLVVSVALVTQMGIAGAVLGTVASYVLTVFWREPYLLYKYLFHTSMRHYWVRYAKFAVVTIALCVALTFALDFLALEMSWPVWLLSALVCLLSHTVVCCLLFCRSDEFRYYIDFVRRRLFKRG